MKFLLTLILGLLINCATAQQFKINYRTAIDSMDRLHYLVFADSSHCKLIYPFKSHGDRQQRNFNLKYQVSQDTIAFYDAEKDLNNQTVERLLKSKFIVTRDGQLFDIVSGYTYVDNRHVSFKYAIFCIDGKIYKQKVLKNDGYGLVRKNYRINRELKRRLKQIDPTNYKVKIVRGRKSYDKYGIVGMNGVIEITNTKPQ